VTSAPAALPVNTIGTPAAEVVYVFRRSPFGSVLRLQRRGVIDTGEAADIAVFNIAVPDRKGGRTGRDTRRPPPMRLTLVNGVPTSGP
jgi:hypothetical protein